MNPALVRLAAVCLVAIGYGLSSRAAEQATPDPMPPPPELLSDLPLDPDDDPPPAPDPAEATRRALQPPARVAARPAPAAYAGRAGGVNVSPPAAAMPAEYFDLPLDAASLPPDEAGVPGVILPELDETFREPAPRGRADRSRQAADQGMTIRQLAPYFALAKGSEGEALAAGRQGDESGSAGQTRKAIDAYMEIINMADAANEAREEAWYGVARCEYRLGNWWRAFDALERSFPGRFDKGEVAGRVKLEMFIGERLWRMAETPVPDAAEEGLALNGYQAASRVYAAVIFNQPSEADAPLALLRRGDASALEGKWADAARYYRQVVEYFPASEPAMQARSSLTEAIYRQEWPAGFPEAARKDVASIMDDVERAASDLTGEAEERRLRAVSVANDLEADGKLRHAREYLKNVRLRKSRDAAVFLLGDVVSRYPGTAQAREAADLLRGMGIEPPLILSDGKRFPLTTGWSGRDDGIRETGGAAGGSVVLGGQDTPWQDAHSPSPGEVGAVEVWP